MNYRDTAVVAALFNAAIDDNLFIDAMMPLWAVKRSMGNYKEPGATLATRDGRNLGNAVVLEWREELPCRGSGCLRAHAKVMTDIGTILYMNEEELRELFFPPQYVANPLEAEAARTRYNRG